MPAPESKAHTFVGLLGILILAVLITAAVASQRGTSSGYTPTTEPAASNPVAESSDPEPVATPEPTPEPTEKPTPTGPVTRFGDGTFVVGTDIVAGTYKSAGPTSSEAFDQCYWARLRDTTGGLGAIIANGNSKGPITVTVAKSDAAFESDGCQRWRKVG